MTAAYLGLFGWLAGGVLLFTWAHRACLRDYRRLLDSSTRAVERRRETRVPARVVGGAESPTASHPGGAPESPGWSRRGVHERV